MKKLAILIIVILSFFVLCGCGDRTFDIYTAKNKIQTLQVNELEIYYWSKHVDSWRIIVECPTECGPVKLEVDGENLDRVLIQMIKQIECIKKANKKETPFDEA